MRTRVMMTNPAEHRTRLVRTNTGHGFVCWSNPSPYHARNCPVCYRAGLLRARAERLRTEGEA